MKNSLRMIFATADKGRLQREVAELERTRERFSSLIAQAQPEKVPERITKTKRLLAWFRRTR